MKSLRTYLRRIFAKKAMPREAEFLGYEAYVPISTFRSMPIKRPAVQPDRYRKAT